MTVYGVTDAGFIPKPVSAILASMRGKLLASPAFGNTFDVSDEGPAGQILGVLAQPIGDVWDLGLALYSCLDPDQATGVPQVSLAALTGTLPLQPARSTVDEVLFGSAGIVVPADTLLATSTDGVQWRTQNSAALAAVASWASGTAYSVGDLRQNDTGKVYYCTEPGTSAGSGGPTGTAADIVDNTVHWHYCGTLGSGSPGAAVVGCESVDFGPYAAPADTLTVLVSPNGVDQATNPVDALPGRSSETSAELRIRRMQELMAPGTSPLEAIRADLLEVEGVVAVSVLDNVTDSTDGDGLPGHSVEAVILGGDDQAIREQLFRSVSAGIQTHGTVVGTIIDSQGFSHTIKFSRPTAVPIYVDVALTKNTNPLLPAYPTDGDAQVKQKIVDFAAGLVPPFPELGIGDDVIDSALNVPVFQVAGVWKIASIKIGTAPSPTQTADLAIAARQLATFATTRVTVTAS